MEAIRDIRKEVLELLETAGEKTLESVYAILQIDAEEDLENLLPDEVKNDLNTALEESANNEGLSHEEVKSKYPQWFTK